MCRGEVWGVFRLLFRGILGLSEGPGFRPSNTFIFGDPREARTNIHQGSGGLYAASSCPDTSWQAKILRHFAQRTVMAKKLGPLAEGPTTIKWCSPCSRHVGHTTWLSPGPSICDGTRLFKGGSGSGVRGRKWPHRVWSRSWLEVELDMAGDMLDRFGQQNMYGCA